MKIERIVEDDERELRKKIDRIFHEHHKAAERESAGLREELVKLLSLRAGRWYAIPEPGDSVPDVPASLRPPEGEGK